MITVNVSQTVRDLARGFAGLSKLQIAKSSSQAINQTLLLGRTVARKEVKKVYNIPQKNLSGINITRSKPNYLRGSVYASSKPIPMDAFSPKFIFKPAAGGSSRVTVSRRGVQKLTAVKKPKQQVGVTIEVKRGERVTVPYAFLIPGAKPRVFARGEYKAGNGSYGFLQRHTRKENDSGNDSVTPLASVTVFAAVINPMVKTRIARKVEAGFPDNMVKALRRQAGAL